MTQRTIRRVEVSSLFWRDLDDWRRHPDYDRIRADVAGMVGRMMRGEPAGDAPFRGASFWGGVRHMHVAAKLIVFLTYPDEETVRLCAIKKHDFYGFRSERKSLAANAASVVLRSALSEPQPYPDWGRLSWRDPADILTSAELRELSRDALDALYREVVEEGESFGRLRRATEGMTDRNAARVADAWIEDLLRAEAAVQAVILERASHRHAHTPPEVLTGWAVPGG